MSDEAVKRRLRRAIRAAIKALRRSGYSVSKYNGSPYDLSADRYRDIRKIKINLDKLSSIDLKNIQQDDDNAIHSREIWVYKTSPGKGSFSIKII